VPTSEKWRSPAHTTEKPGDDWIKPDFNADSWKAGQGGFGEPDAEQQSPHHVEERRHLDPPRLRLEGSAQGELFLTFTTTKMPRSTSMAFWRRVPAS
jgi:hypothetical protein